MFQIQKQPCFLRFICNSSLQTNLNEPEKKAKGQNNHYTATHITDPEGSRRFKLPDFQTIGA
jgi:hypothetical protein